MIVQRGSAASNRPDIGSTSVAYGDSVKAFTLSNGVNQLDFNFEAPVFFASGVGNGIINVPSRVTSARISGTYTGDCADFRVEFQNGASMVAEILGTGVAPNGCTFSDFVSSGTHYEAVVKLSVPQNGTTLKVSAAGVWSFEEVR